MKFCVLINNQDSHDIFVMHQGKAKDFVKYSVLYTADNKDEAYDVMDRMKRDKFEIDGQ